jgi:hypothetical protein
LRKDLNYANWVQIPTSTDTVESEGQHEAMLNTVKVPEINEKPQASSFRRMPPDLNFFIFGAE